MMRPYRLPRLLAGAAAVLALAAAPATLVALTATPAAAEPSAQPSAQPTSPDRKTISFGIRPADEREYFHVGLAAGETTIRPALISNYSPKEVDLLIYPADATITAQGGFAIAERDAPVVGLGTWIHLPVGRVHLDGNQSKAVKFPITVPAQTDPGDYAGGVVVQRVDPGTATTVQNGFAVQLDIVQRVGARIYLNVAGEAKPGLKVGALSWHHTGRAITFTVPVTNTGNVRLKPTATVNLHGFNLPTRPITTSRIEDLLPGSTVTMTGTLARPPVFGTGKATATVDDGIGNKEAAVVPLSLIPVVPIAGIVLGIGVLLFAVRRYLRFLRRARAALRLAGSAGQPA